MNLETNHNQECQNPIGKFLKWMDESLLSNHLKKCPLQQRINDSAGVVRPGVWSQKSVDFEIFGDLIDKIYDQCRCGH